MNHMHNNVTSVMTYMSVMNFALSIIENVFVNILKVNNKNIIFVNSNVILSLRHIFK